MFKKPKKINEMKYCDSSKNIYPGVLGRLINDVEPAIDYYRKTGYGNWSSIRMTAPIIESISGGNKSLRNQILVDIGIKYPNIFWLIYRNGLIHNDGSPLSIQMGSRTIGWGFGWGSGPAAQMVDKKHYTINPGILFDNLKTWLKNKIAEKYDVSIEETKLISINENEKSVYRDEFEQMLKK